MARGAQSNWSPTRFSLDRPEGVAAVWEQMMQSLSRSGFQHAGSEYLRLSQRVLQLRRAALISGSDSDAAKWDCVRQLGGQAVALLQPIMEAARILSELPSARTASSLAAATSEPAGPARAGDLAPSNRAEAMANPKPRGPVAAK